MKMLLIVSCRDKSMWYANMIEKYVPFVRECADYYWSREQEGYTNIVMKYDAMIVVTPTLVAGE